ncbi:hypothetical protein IFM89_014934 [Coptis chinensis]|uniref:Amidase domain-containing protein n=1 Tax=Coptis chinensis TaxID=261450 RepID=A0A835H5E6_9MAGN|nr:hypothetical protein IFM89_014934 [Coptis chinensis]
MMALGNRNIGSVMDLMEESEGGNDSLTAKLMCFGAGVVGGATCTGKTVVDEMALSINGVNTHYGIPTNPAAPTLLSGGSSSGSAVAVVAGLTFL